MAWSADWPLSQGSDLNKYDALIQLYKAASERRMAAENNYFPKYNLVWGNAYIDAVAVSGDYYTLSQNEEDWAPIVGCEGYQRYYNYDCPIIFDFVPRYYQCYIRTGTHLEEKKVIGPFEIFASDSGNRPSQSGTITIKNLDNWVAVGIIGSTSDVIGKELFIIKEDGLFWNERWLEWPNSNEYYKGTITSGNNSTVFINGETFTENELSGKDLLAFVGDKIKRVSITAHPSGNSLNFTPSVSGLGGTYSIVDAGEICYPGKTSGKPHKWYAGVSDLYWTHNPGDSLSDNSATGGITSTSLPASTLTYDEPDSGSTCVPVVHTAFDVDLWSDFDNDCPPHEDSKAPDFMKSIRGLQVWLEGICSSFVPVENYDAVFYQASLMVPAIMFKHAGVNYLGTSSATSDVGGNVTFTITELVGSETAYYAVYRNDTRDYVDFGSSIGSGVYTYNVGAEGISVSLVLARGWTRKYPKEFKYMYDRTCFIPDFDGNSVEDPPTEAAPGVWEIREKSINLKITTETGFVQETGPVFSTNDRARYSGDNDNDPGINPNDPVLVSAPLRPNGFDQTTPYYDFFYEGYLPDSDEASYQNMIQGIVSSGTTRSIYSPTQNWWGAPLGVGVLRTETGTATGGGSTFLIDTSKEGNVYWHNTGRYNGFILELLSGNYAGRRVPILTTNNPASGYLTFDSAHNVVVSGGEQYQIREPAYILNFFKDGNLTVTRTSDGYNETRTITNNDDEYIFVSSAFSFVPSGGDTYSISKRRTGTVWDWNGSGWIAPNVNRPQNGIAPDIVTSYGKCRKGDYVFTNTFNEIYRCLNVLVWTKTNIGWKSRLDDDVSENNYKDALSFVGTDCENYDCDAAKVLGVDCWNTGMCSSYYFDDVPSPPFAVASLGNYCDGVGHAALSRAYGYAEVTVPTKWCNRDIDFFAYATTINGDEYDFACFKNTFSNYGDDVLYNLYSKFATDSSNTLTVKKLLGSMTIPAWGTCPPVIDFMGDGDPVSDCQLTSFAISTSSYEVTNQYAIVKWDVTGGFVYVD